MNYALASRYNRLLACLWDGLYCGWPMLLGLACMIPMMGMLDRSYQGWAFLPYGLGALVTMGLGLYNLVLVCRTGQTMGKRRLGLKVVKLDGEPLLGLGQFWRCISPTVISMVPLVGIVAAFDAFFIFGNSRRCLHDYLAGSVVVDKDSLGEAVHGVGLNPVVEDVGFTRF